MGTTHCLPAIDFGKIKAMVTMKASLSLNNSLERSNFFMVSSSQGFGETNYKSKRSLKCIQITINSTILPGKGGGGRISM